MTAEGLAVSVLKGRLNGKQRNRLPRLLRDPARIPRFDNSRLLCYCSGALSHPLLT